MTTTASSSSGLGPAPAASDLTVEEQASLTAGSDMWHSTGIERLGLPAFGLTDGPSGARGFQFTGATSTSLPCGTALASTWNRELIGRVGRLLGQEARSKDASMLLAPTVNIQRHPLGGRSFECYSEDPYLTAEIASAFIEGVQSQGVACSVKHFVLNDQETDRMEIDTVVDERTRREIYYPPFEAAVRAGVWSVMAAYNRVDGIHCSQHPGLLTDLLRDEWGFDGVVVSDWFGAHSTEALAAGMDLEMPGPPQVLGAHLLAALEAGELSAAAVERAAQRMLDLLDRTAPSRQPAAAGDPVAGGAEAARIAREAATEGIVLLANDGVLPLDAPAAPSIAVIGWRADQVEIQGGGSAQVTPPYINTPLQGISERAAAGTVSFESGRPTPKSVPLTGRLIAASGGEDRGIVLEYFPAGDLTGAPLHRETLLETMAIWLGEPAPGIQAGDFSARMTAPFVPDASGRWTLSISGIGTARLLVDGEVVGDTSDAEASEGLLGLFTAAVECEVDVVAGTTYQVVAEFDAAPAEGPIQIAGLTVAASPPAQVDAVERAVQAAAGADTAVVVVGHEERVTEGADASTIDLPPEQVDLLRQVAAANPRTVVVVNAATPIAMDWADEVAAVVQLGYQGQETGAALAAVLFGDADATGRLTTTYPVRLEDAPAHASFPGADGTVSYDEGLFVGYRHYDTKGVEPLWCFGHGLSYTSFAHTALTIAADPADGAAAGVLVSVDVTNTGERAGSEVVQVYVRHVGAEVERPDRELKGFAKVALEPGETATVTMALDPRAFAYWDTGLGAWHAPAGAYEILVGSSSRAIHQTADLVRPAAWTS
jgi:beta-glucosidase